MAEKRMISKSISISEKVNIGLPNLFDKLLFTWMIPHADDFGRMPGSPAKIKALVVPMLDVTLKEVEESIQNIHNAELIFWYEIDGDKYIQIVNFDDHQTGLHKRTKSKFPECTEYSRKFPEIPSEQNRTEQNRREENGTDFRATNLHEKKISQWITQYKIKGAGVDGMDTICSYIGQADLEVIEKALMKSEGKHVNYFVSVINGFITEGITRSTDLNHIPAAGEKKIDKDLEARRRDIAFNKWIAEGKNPDDFRYASNH